MPNASRCTEVCRGDAIRIEWTGATDAEVGYRVDRRIGAGDWAAIAYRPPQKERHPQNEPAWLDFLAPGRATHLFVEDASFMRTGAALWCIGRGR